MRYFYLLLSLLLCSVGVAAQNGAVPKHEVRAVWLTTIGGLDWPHSYAQTPRSIEKQKDELRSILDKLYTSGINTVLLQTRVRGTVIYPSNIEPWDGCLSGKPGVSPGYDALQFAIDECHRRGMELHAWIVTMPVGKWDKLGCQLLRKRMSRNIIRIKTDGFMNPESQLTADYLADLCAEVTARYDIDGIHLDYIRYPEELPKLRTMSHSEGRSNITRIVRTVSERVKRLKPWVKMSCSPIGKYNNTARYWSHGWNAYETVCQDAVAWLRDGLMDELFPMMYFRDNNFFPFALDWKEQSYGRIIAPGLGIYFMSPREKNWDLADITRELSFLRNNNMGHAYFRSKFFTDDTKGLFQYAKNELCTYPALVPPMTWAHADCPQAPYSLGRRDCPDNTTVITWQHVQTDTTMVLFNVYASEHFPVDVDDVRNLVAARRQGRSLIVPRNPHLHYAVCATDRYGNESRALQENDGNEGRDNASGLSVSARPLLRCDGSKVEVPEALNSSDATHLIIETMEGCAVDVVPVQRGASYVSVGSLAEGIYTLRSLNSKGISHRLGVFRKNL